MGKALSLPIRPASGPQIEIEGEFIPAPGDDHLRHLGSGLVPDDVTRGGELDLVATYVVREAPVAFLQVSAPFQDQERQVEPGQRSSGAADIPHHADEARHRIRRNGHDGRG